MVAIACVQRLAASAHDPAPEIAVAIAEGWNRSMVAADRNALADHMEQRSDADDDLVAAAIYSLRASLGSVQDAWWAVSRFIDAAFESAVLDDSMTSGDALDNAATQPIVRAELEWLQAILIIAEAATDGIHLADQLAQRSRREQS